MTTLPDEVQYYSSAGSDSWGVLSAKNQTVATSADVDIATQLSFATIGM